MHRLREERREERGERKEERGKGKQKREERREKRVGEKTELRRKPTWPADRSQMISRILIQRSNMFLSPCTKEMTCRSIRQDCIISLVLQEKGSGTHKANGPVFTCLIRASSTRNRTDRSYCKRMGSSPCELTAASGTLSRCGQTAAVSSY